MSNGIIIIITYRLIVDYYIQIELLWKNNNNNNHISIIIISNQRQKKK